MVGEEEEAPRQDHGFTVELLCEDTETHWAHVIQAILHHEQPTLDLTLPTGEVYTLSVEKVLNWTTRV